MIIGQIDPLWLRDEISKDIFFGALLPKMLFNLEAEITSVVVTSWMLTADPDFAGGKRFHTTAEQMEMYLENNLGPISEHPDRIEVVSVATATREDTIFSTARIIRRKESHPKLRKWMDYDEAEHLTGRIIDNLHEGMRYAYLIKTDPMALLEDLKGRITEQAETLVDLLMADPAFQEWAEARKRGEA